MQCVMCVCLSVCFKNSCLIFHIFKVNFLKSQQISFSNVTVSFIETSISTSQFAIPVRTFVARAEMFSACRGCGCSSRDVRQQQRAGGFSFTTVVSSRSSLGVPSVRSSIGASQERLRTQIHTIVTTTHTAINCRGCGCGVYSCLCVSVCVKFAQVHAKSACKCARTGQNV